MSTVKSPDARVAAILDQLAARGCAGRRPGRQSSRRSVDVSTVYRTLDTLEQLGIIDHTHLAHGPAIFHLADGDHQHLVCERCGRVEEVAPEKLEPFLKALREDFDFDVDRRHFALVGICGACRDG